MNASDYFRPTYAENRSKFLDGCRATNANLQSIPHPKLGPEGERLSLDVARLGERHPRVLVVCAGTHGVEGFCGSAVLNALLHEGLVGSLPPGVTLVLMHALNPYGYAWLRRTDHENIDLNRNFIDHAQPHPVNAAYAQIHGLLVPAEWEGPAREAADAQLKAYRSTRGDRAFQAAVSGGQYDFPDGLFYGGRAPAWSNETWHRVLRDQVGESALLAVIDIHSGLGLPGHCELISNSAPESAERARVVQWFGNRVVAPGVDSTASAADGDLGRSLARILPKTDGAAVVAEFGTVDLERVFNALRADNWIHAYDQPGTARWEGVKRDMYEAFVRPDDDWKRAIVEQGVDLVMRVGQSLAATALPALR